MITAEFLKQRLGELDKSFAQHDQQRIQLESQMTIVKAKLTQLQGAYAEVSKMLGDLPEAKDPVAKGKKEIPAESK